MRHALSLAMFGGRETRHKQKMPHAILVTHKDTLCEVRFWTEAEWNALPIGKRPRECMHKPGGGWVGLVPATVSNVG